LKNVGSYIPINTASLHGRPKSTSTLPWKSQVSHSTAD